jgi:hypothetical protein
VCFPRTVDAMIGSLPVPNSAVLGVGRQPFGTQPMNARSVATDVARRHELSSAGPPMQQPGCQHATNRAAQVRLPADAGGAGEDAPDESAVEK